MNINIVYGGVELSNLGDSTFFFGYSPKNGQ